MHDEEVAKHLSSKDTKSWCKGKKGKEHVLKCEKMELVSGSGDRGDRVLRCVVCGKKLKMYINPRNLGAAPEKPDWVDC